MRQKQTRSRIGKSRKGGAAAGLWPVWLAGLALTLAGAFVALKLDRATGSIEPHRYERFVDSLRDSGGAG
ncbi:MAG: hypothetical protein ACXW3O_04140 [Brevundimonas sp.]